MFSGSTVYRLRDDRLVNTAELLKTLRRFGVTTSSEIQYVDQMVSWRINYGIGSKQYEASRIRTSSN